MPRTKGSEWTVEDYDRAADDYQRRLPLEHYTEGVPQATQRKITLESLDILAVRRPDVRVFNELLIQYFYKGRLRRVVPDNMLRLGNRPTVSLKSYILIKEESPPFLVFEYVSLSNPRKDYQDSFHKYETELCVPYCLLYHPNREEFQAHHHNGSEYERILPNARGRFDIPELDIEVAVQNGWVRYWYKGELLPLPGEMLDRIDTLSLVAEQERHRAERERHRAEQAEAELARLRALLAEQSAPKTQGGHPRNEP